MKTQPLYRYLTMAALLGIWSCSSTRQTAQNVGEVDDLYGTSGNAQVYASTTNDASAVQRPARQRNQQGRNANPDYNDEQQGYSTNADEYYSELSTRKLNRGISPDPGWGDNATNAYNSGFVNGYNAASTSAYSWNRWGFNNLGFYSGLGIGLGYGGFGGFNRFGYGGFGGYPYYDTFAYSPYGYGFGGGFSPFYSPFYSPFGYSTFAYSPFGYPYGGGYGGYYGGGYYGGYTNNVVVVGADPYRNRTYIRSNNGSARTYGSDFENSPRAYTNSGGRRGSSSTYNNGYSNSGSTNSGYYSRPATSSRGSYYYDNSASSNGRTSGSAPAYSSGSSSSNSQYYARPRESSRGSYTPSDYNSGGRSSYQQQPAYQQQQRTYQQQPAYQSQSRGSYSAPSYSAPSGGGSSGGGAPAGGGGRGPR
ncbi:hypothetical protein GCM10027578_16520 [Spirosoma luteolum]